MLIKIGADEIILWLRKRGRVKCIPNDGVKGLGRMIHDLICEELGGKKNDDNKPTYWSVENNNLVNECNLPKTSAQYKLDSNQLPKLFQKINSW